MSAALFVPSLFLFGSSYDRYASHDTVRMKRPVFYSSAVVLKFSARWPPIQLKYTIFCRPRGLAQQLLWHMTCITILFVM